MLRAVSLIILVTFGLHVPGTRQDTQDACVALLSGFPKDVPAPPKPQYPPEKTDITLEYFASGCYGNCPAFNLTISKDTAVFEGHAHVRAKGKEKGETQSARVRDSSSRLVRREFLRYAR